MVIRAAASTPPLVVDQSERWHLKAFVVSDPILPFQVAQGDHPSSIP